MSQLMRQVISMRKNIGIEVQPKDFKDDKAKPLKIAGKETTKLWDEITSQPFNTPFEKA